MGKALETLHKTREELKVEKRIWLKQNNHDVADKINEEILDIEIAISELVRKDKTSERVQANELLPHVSGSASDAKHRYKKAWSFVNEDWDGETTTLAIMDKALRIASGYDRSK